MDLNTMEEAVARRLKAVNDRISKGKEDDQYFYYQPVEELLGGSKVRVRGQFLFSKTDNS